MTNFKFCIPLLIILSSLFVSNAFSQGFEGYYQYPDISGERLVFCAEGDLWTVSLDGGLAQRLTTHPEEEIYPLFSPDGSTIMFAASYEGPTELYTIPGTGGLTKRWSFEREASIPNTWTPDGSMVYATVAYNKKPDLRLVKIDPLTKSKSHIPLDQASEACFDETAKTVYFVRPAYHRNVTKRYQGGTARQIWKFTEGTDEAIKLTTDHAGESHHPMYHNGRVYFITDRDGVMNIWSMATDGSDKRQHTEHEDFDVRYANLDGNTIVYQMGADIWKYSIETDQSEKINITLATDLDQLREKWEENPSQYITNVKADKSGDKVVITARGRVFVFPVKSGRMIAFDRDSDIRYRDAVFSHDGENIIVLSDESREFEFVQLPANGIGEEKTLSSDGQILRYQGMPSPDGKWLAYDDLANNMYVLNMESGESTLISTNQEGIGDFSWAPDSKWIAFVQTADNTMRQIRIHNIEDNSAFFLTTDRANSVNPRWSPDGKFIYFISDRSFTTLVNSPWGPRQPEPYFDASEKIYHVALTKGTRSPFRPMDELYENEDGKDDTKEKENEEENKDDKELSVLIDVEGIQKRIQEVPVKPGNYRSLQVNDKALYLIANETGIGANAHLKVIKITNEDVELETLADDISTYDISGDGKKLLISKDNNLYMVSAGTGKISKLNEGKIDLGGWKFLINPRKDWQQIFTDAWRMERDYFYDENMHGVDWDAMHDKYYPLVNRVTTRNELSDLIGRFVGELSALHTSVRGGDTRSDEKNISVANLGAEFSRDENAGGFKIEYIYKADPDYPDEKSPLDDPYLDVKIGDIVTHVNGVNALGALDIGELIRNQEGKQVRLTLKRAADTHDIIVVPIGSSFNLRYRDWEYSNRLYVEEQSENEIGYLHLRAMGGNDINQFYREFYPVFNRKGLIIDVRYNNGGNIDSYILEKLMRKAWMYWSSRSGKPQWNMQYAFRGHVVVLVNENTYSDGEAFADGFTQLGLGTSIGTRTWGGEIWLSSVNRLSDSGIARAPMFGVYGDGVWRVEGHGYEPDIVIDNLPHSTFNGSDAQLDKAIEVLKEKIKEDPREVPDPPPFPDKSFRNNRK